MGGLKRGSATLGLRPEVGVGATKTPDALIDPSAALAATPTVFQPDGHTSPGEKYPMTKWPTELKADDATASSWDPDG